MLSRAVLADVLNETRLLLEYLNKTHDCFLLKVKKISATFHLELVFYYERGTLLDRKI